MRIPTHRAFATAQPNPHEYDKWPTRYRYDAGQKKSVPVMSVLEPSIWTLRRWRSWVESIIAFSMILLVCVATALVFGKDFNWDLLNYHFYSAHAFLHVPLDEDFLGGSTQRYLNPLAYLPFYWMVTAEWHSVVIGTVLASFHALNVFCVWHLAHSYIFKNDPDARTLALLSTAFAFLSPVFLGTLGGTFIDPITSVFTLAALIAACRALRSTNALPWILTVGILSGTAFGLKLTNVVFVLAFALALAACAGSLRRSLWTAVQFGTGSLLGLLASNANWSMKLYEEFGNPVFPLLNQYFRSPDFPDWTLQHRRFLPEGLLDAMQLPLKLLERRSWVYIENAAPDWRVAALCLALIALCITSIIRQRKVLPQLEWPASPRALVVIFFVGASALWMKSSGNGRYAIPLFLLLGPMLVWTVSATIHSRRFAIGTLLVALSVQFYVVLEAGNPRWTHETWGNQWFELSIPAALRDHPYGFLVFGSNSHSFLAPQLHPNSRFSHIFGAYTVDPDGPGADRVRAFVKRHRDALRLIVKVTDSSVGKRLQPSNVFQFDTQLASWNLRVDTSDCEYMVLSPKEPVATFLSCRLVTGNPMKTEIDLGRMSIDRAFNRVELVCPALFSPAGAYTVRQGKVWLRRYLNSDIVLSSRIGRIQYSRYDFGPFDVDIGAVELWSEGIATMACPSLARLNSRTAP